MPATGAGYRLVVVWLDDDYIRALVYRLPPTDGHGPGIDQLAILLTDLASIRDVLLFPYMRREG